MRQKFRSDQSINRFTARFPHRRRVAPSSSTMTEDEWSVLSSVGSPSSEPNMSSTASESGESSASRSEDESRSEIIADATTSDKDDNEETTFWTAFGEGEFIDLSQAAEILAQQIKCASSSISLSSHLC